MNKEFEVISAKTIMKARNIEIKWNGWLFDIVYWKREEDWFLAIPNYHISCIISEPTDTIYNLGKILAMVMLQAVKEDYEEWKKENQ